MLTHAEQYGFVIMQSAAQAIGGGTAVQCTSAGDGAGTTIAMQVSGTFVATVNFEATIDGSDWFPVSCTNITDGTVATTATAPGIFRMISLGLVGVRARIKSYTSGAVTITAITVTGAQEISQQQAVTWLLRDEFTTDRAAGAVNGTAAEPGPGTRTVVDTTGKLSIASSALTVAANGTQPDPRLYYEAIARAAGRMLLSSWRYSYAGYDTVGFQQTIAGTTGIHGVYVYANTIRNINATLNLGDVSINTDYRFATILRATGSMVFVYGGAYGTNWIFLYPFETYNTATIFPMTTANNPGAARTNGFIRIPDELWLPVPLISDSFSSAFGTSDGLGHQEGIAGGIGAGGSGVVWTGSTWSVVGGKAVNTPSVGAELIVNGNCELDSNWTALSLAPTTNERSTEQVHGGTYSRKLVGNAAASGIRSDYFTVSAGDWVRCSPWVYGAAGNALLRIQDGNGTDTGFSVTLDTAGWNQYYLCTRVATSGATSHIKIYQNGATVATRYLDDVSAKILALTDLISSVVLSTADVVAGVALTITRRYQAGLCLNLDSTSSPANFVIAYHDNANAILEKCVAGVYTTLVSVAATYSAGARLVVQKNGTKYRLYYNNTFVGTEQTISDAGIISNTRHGLFSTDIGNTLDDFVAYPTGTDGEYSFLDRYSFD